jgi:putative DNA primase/helicase
MIAAACQQATPTSTGWQACCPAHDDSHPSLSIGYTDDKVLLCCHAGCDFDAICTALMLKPAELFCGERWGNSPITDVYDYVDEHGTLLFQVCRTLDKKFPQRRPDGQWKIPGVRRVLYHLPQLRAGIAAGETIYLVEGEKDVHTLERLGLIATCNPMGAVHAKGKAKWLNEYSETLRGAHVVLLADHDNQGAAHVDIISSKLAGIAASIKIPSGIHTHKPGSDVTDWVAAGGTREQLVTAVEACPVWTSAFPDFHAIPPRSSNGSHPPTDPPVPPTGRQFDPDSLYTDSYNARALVAAHGADMRYCTAWKVWLVWTGTHWQRDKSRLVMRWAKHTIKDLATLMQQMDNEQCGKLMKHITSSLSTSKLKAMVENAESEAGMTVEPDTFDRDPWLLNCANGTIDLRTGTLRPASREDYLTRCLSIRYNPQATCPTWQGFLDRVMGGKQGLVAFLHRAIGYSLTGSTIEQCLFILHGPTKTGKSTFLSRLLALLGTYGTTADMESFMHKDRPEIRADLADLAGARVVCAVEAQEGKRLNENLIKQLTGGVDQVKARFLFEDYFTFTPQFKVFLGTNHKPVIKDNDQAIWERIRLVPFVVQIPPGERKKDFDAELHQEIEGILAWAVQGCLDWQRLGDLKPPPEVVNATKEYQEESDIIGRFIADKCVKLTQAEARASALWNAYKDWCEHHGETWVKQTAFGRKLTEEGFGKRESHGIIYTGIGLRSEDQD